MSISSVPKSWIEGPGTLIQRGASSQGSIPAIGTTQNQITRCTSRKGTNLSPEETLSEQNEPVTTSEGSLQKYCSDSHAGPGKLKMVSESFCTLLKKAKDFLELYGINIVVEVPEKKVKETCMILNTLMSEVCLLPYEFMKRLQVKQFTITNSHETDATNLFYVETLDTQQKISTRFYEIVFHHLVAQNEIFLCEWKSIVVRLEKEDSWKLEEVFVMLMGSANHAFAKQKIVKLRELLGKYFPGEIDDEYFQARANLKKKLLVNKYIL